MKLTFRLKRLSNKKNPFNFLYGYLLLYLQLVLKQSEIKKSPIFYLKGPPKPLWRVGKKKTQISFYFFFCLLRDRDTNMSSSSRVTAS